MKAEMKSEKLKESELKTLKFPGQRLKLSKILA